MKFLAAALILLAAAPAHAFAILFYDVRPAEKLMDIPSLTGSRTVSPRDFKKLTALDLLEYDLVYIDATADDLHFLSENSTVLHEAVALGVGLYIQGDIAAYAASPVETPVTSAVKLRAFDLPNDAYNHPLVADADLMPDDFGDATNAKARGFRGVPEGFSVIAEAENLAGERLPMLLAGMFGKGRVVLRTHDFKDASIDGVEKIDAAIIAWITSKNETPRSEPLAWIVKNHPRAYVTVDARDLVQEIMPVDFHAAPSRKTLKMPAPLPTFLSVR